MILRTFTAAIVSAAAFTTAIEPAESRQNLGLYGGTILSSAWDRTHGKLFASVAGPLSLFASTDTGRTWKPAFPKDSLKWMEGPDMRGWAGRGMNVWSQDGITMCRSVEEGGVLWALTLSSDGERFRTIWDEILKRRWREAWRNSHQRDPFPGGLNTALIHRGSLLLGMGGGLLVSKDTGSTWKPWSFPDSAGMFQQDPAKQHRIQNVVVAKDDFSRVLVVASKPTSDMGSSVNGSGEPWITTDSGKTWKLLAIPDTIGASDTTHLSNVSLLWQAGKSSDTMLIGNAAQPNGSPTPPPALFLSTDRGATWKRIYRQTTGPGQNSPQVGGIAVFQDSFLPGPSGIRLVSGYDYSDDLATSWKRMEKAANGEIGQVSAITGHIPGTNIWFAGSALGPKTSFDGMDSPNYRLGTDGMTSLSIMRVAQLPGDLNRVYLATGTGLAFTRAYTDTSVKGEAKWKAPYGQFPIMIDQSGSVSDVAINPWDSAMLVAATGNGIQRTVKGGHRREDWMEIPFRNIPGWKDWCWVRDIRFYSRDTIYAATKGDQTNDGGLLASYDTGKSWASVAAIGNRPVNSVTVADNGKAKMIYVGTGKGSVPGWLFRSADGGKTWDSIPGLDARNNPGRKQLPVRDVEPRPGSVDTIYIAGGDNTDWAVGWSFNRGDSIRIPGQRAGGAEISRIAVNKHHPDSVYFAMRNAIVLLDLSSGPQLLDPLPPLNPGDTAKKILPPPGDTGKMLPMETVNFMMNWFVGYPGEILYDIHYDELMMASSVGAFGVRSQGGTPNTNIRQRPKASSDLIVHAGLSRIRVSFANPTGADAQVEILDLRGHRVASVQATHRQGRSEAVISRTHLGRGSFVLRAIVDGRAQQRVISAP
ncbi:MAG: hypothetical protein IPK50_13655 [Fibrobacterota bacterium]|nr:hypothetical protein [Fibrobacterota bacterium]QQS03350.1 MAG: hypothetical protein IPK50_13655 [Fibrobacterota bacterium]